HVVGLFRIWTIPYAEPLENQGLNGFFDPQDQKEWEIQGRTILKLILDHTDMLICAEDLGVIPLVCTQTLEEFGIPGNDVQRWKKDYKVSFNFLAPEGYRFLSVSMLSTHDTTLWPTWWEEEAGTVDRLLFMRRCKEREINFEKIKTELFDLENSTERRLRWRREIDSEEKLVKILGKPKEKLLDFIGFYKESFAEREKLFGLFGFKGMPPKECTPEIITSALKLVLESSSIFCINVIFDWLFFMQEIKEPAKFRINTPGTISNQNWSVLLPLSLEDLLSHPKNKEILELNKATQRV
ncbi:MAG: 4-alpha-glucanotransferase, partial [Candidatus Omnitrophica bacterium]|nr:4-alpha-glucanotransferase [Candidatus Omnitrophota bacterium]